MKSKVLWNALCDSLPQIPDNRPFWYDGERVLCKNEKILNQLADAFDAYEGEGVAVTGYYDPKEDEQGGHLDTHTGYYYVEF